MNKIASDAELEGMTEEELKARADFIIEMAANAEAAHEKEDQLHREVIAAFALRDNGVRGF